MVVFFRLKCSVSSGQALTVSLFLYFLVTFKFYFSLITKLALEEVNTSPPSKHIDHCHYVDGFFTGLIMSYRIIESVRGNI